MAFPDYWKEHNPRQWRQEPRHAASFSRGMSPRGLHFLLLTQCEGSGAPTGARVHRHPFVSGPITPVRASPRREAFTVCAPGDARLSALHRGGLLASGPARDKRHTTLPSFSVHWACEHLASARNGGGRVSGASRASVCMDRLAGRRIPSCFSNASRKHPRRTGQQDDSPW